MNGARMTEQQLTVLITGGAGYIGSHTAVSCLNAGHRVVVLDDLSNGHSEAIDRIERICERTVTFYRGSCLDSEYLDQIFSEQSIDAVIHFAGLKAVGDSVRLPLDYYRVNVAGTVSLLSAMQRAGVSRLVFSSSATVYGVEAEIPYRETEPRGSTTSPYGASKAMVERILEDLALADPQWSIVNLRYFNPIGAHNSGLIGEYPRGVPNNLMPFIAQVAVGRRPYLSVYGDDYATPDGTCRRDYLHVMDLAEGHTKALERLQLEGFETFNLGTGVPVSVIEMIRAFEYASGVHIPYEIAPRRAGDLPEFWADPSRAEAQLNWTAHRDLQTMMLDTWHWQSQNPNGYASKG